MASFTINNIYDFTTYASSKLGGLHRNMKVAGVFNYETAVTMYRDVDGVHKEIYPLLPISTPVSAKSLNYVLFISPNGTKVILAVEWIDPATEILVSSIDLTAVIRGVTIADLTTIRALLTGAGYSDFSIDQTT